MDKKRPSVFLRTTKTRRRNRPRPFNTRKTLGPSSCWRGMKKKKRGQG